MLVSQIGRLSLGSRAHYHVVWTLSYVNIYYRIKPSTLSFTSSCPKVISSWKKALNKRTCLILLFLLITQNQLLAHAATKTCFCRISHGPQAGPFRIFTSLATGLSINRVITTPANHGDCRNRCTQVFNNNEPSIAQQACAAGIPNGNLILATSQLSTGGTWTAASRRLVNIITTNLANPTICKLVR